MDGMKKIRGHIFIILPIMIMAFFVWFEAAADEAYADPIAKMNGTNYDDFNELVDDIGGKAGNYRAVKTKAKKNKVRLRKGKNFKLRAKAVKQFKKKPVRKHEKMRYESSNRKIATVTSKGTIRAVGKGTCYVCAYAQNGVYKRIRVTVR